MPRSTEVEGSPSAQLHALHANRSCADFKPLHVLTNCCDSLNITYFQFCMLLFVTCVQLPVLMN